MKFKIFNFFVFIQIFIAFSLNAEVRYLYKLENRQLSQVDPITKTELKCNFPNNLNLYREFKVVRIVENKQLKKLLYAPLGSENFIVVLDITSCNRIKEVSRIAIHTRTEDIAVNVNAKERAIYWTDGVSKIYKINLLANNPKSSLVHNQASFMGGILQLSVDSDLNLLHWISKPIHNETETHIFRMNNLYVKNLTNDRLSKVYKLGREQYSSTTRREPLDIGYLDIVFENSDQIILGHTYDVGVSSPSDQYIKRNSKIIEMNLKNKGLKITTGLSDIKNARGLDPIKHDLYELKNLKVFRGNQSGREAHRMNVIGLRLDESKNNLILHYALTNDRLSGSIMAGFQKLNLEGKVDPSNIFTPTNRPPWWAGANTHLFDFEFYLDRLVFEPQSHLNGLNWTGSREKWLISDGNWYFVTSTGRLYRFFGGKKDILTRSKLIGSFGRAFYNRY